MVHAFVDEYVSTRRRVTRGAASRSGHRGADRRARFAQAHDKDIVVIVFVVSNIFV
jgi:hypothetical protein